MTQISTDTASRLVYALDRNENSRIDRRSELSAANVATLDTNGRGYVSFGEAADSLVRISARPDVAAALTRAHSSLGVRDAAVREETRERALAEGLVTEGDKTLAGFAAFGGILATGVLIGFAIGGPFAIALGLMLGLILGLSGGVMFGLTLPKISAECSQAVRETEASAERAKEAFRGNMDAAVALYRSPAPAVSAIPAPVTRSAHN